LRMDNEIARWGVRKLYKPDLVAIVLGRWHEPSAEGCGRRIWRSVRRGSPGVRTVRYAQAWRTVLRMVNVVDSGIDQLWCRR
jgi:hypothetical protein